MGKDGNLKSTYEVLKEISQEWDKMTTAERQALGISLAGKTQFEVFTSVLNNFADAERALTLAEESQGSAWKENARYMESVEAKYQALKTEIENLVLGDGGLSKLIKLVLDLTTKFVKFIDSAGGLITVISALTTALALLNSKAIGTFIAYVPKLIAGLSTLKLGYADFGITVVSTNEAINASIPIIGLVLVAITALIAGISLLSSDLSKSVEKINELGDKLSNEKSEIETLTSKIERLNEKLRELNKIESPTLIEQKEIDKTEYEIVQLERELALKQKIAETDEKRLSRKVEKQVTRTIGSDLGNEYSDLMYRTDAYKYQLGIDLEGKEVYQKIKLLKDVSEAYREQIVELNNQQKALDENSKEYKKLEREIKEYQKQLDYIDERLPKVVEKFDSLKDGLSENNKWYLLIKNTVDYYTDSLLENQEVQSQVGDVDEYIQQTLEETAEEYKLNAEQIEELNDLIEEAIENKSEEESAYEVATEVIDDYISSLDTAIKTWDKWNSKMDSLQSSYDTLSKAVEEYNTLQGFSLDTAQALLALEPEYIAMLDFENDKVMLNKEALMLKAKAHIEDARAMVYEQAEAEINALAQAKLKNANIESTREVKNETQALYENSEALSQNAKEAFNNAYAKAQAQGITIEEMKSVTDKMENQLTILDNLANSFGNNFEKSMQKASSSASKANKEVKILKNTVQQLKDEVADYDKVIAYINGKLDGEIKRLEDLRDKEVEVIEKEIDALEKELDFEEDSIKARIDLLESERDTLIDTNKQQIASLEERQNAEEEYWNNKIQALKDQNNALQDQADLEKLLQDLETARNTKVKVYKKGQGFVWDVDQEAVSKAQKALDAYNTKKEYERKLAELENYKKQAIAQYEEEINYLKNYNNEIKNGYDKQISDLNNYINDFKIRYNTQINNLKEQTEKIKEQYKIQIDYFKNYKTEFDKQVNAYETEQNRLLALQKTGIDFENENWKTRLDNLSKFTTEYNKKLEELANKEKQLKALESGSSTSSSTSTSSGGISGGGSSSTTTTGNRTQTYTVWTAGDKEFGTQSEAVAYIRSIQEQAEKAKKKNADIDAQLARITDPHAKSSLQAQKVSVPTVPSLGQATRTRYYASGVASVGSNQFAIVGENPNKELVIGSKLNGLGLNLAKGTGVVNAKSTGTLAGLFNMLGGEFSKGFTGDYNMNNTSNESSNNIHIDNISLPQVRDAEDFVDALSNFQNIMAQKAYAII